MSQFHVRILNKFIATNNNSEFDNLHNIIQFDIPCTSNALDPKKLFFEVHMNT